jgi:hypothetical protein
MDPLQLAFIRLLRVGPKRARPRDAERLLLDPEAPPLRRRLGGAVALDLSAIVADVRGAAPATSVGS